MRKRYQDLMHLGFNEVAAKAAPTGNWVLEVFSPLPESEAALFRAFMDDDGREPPPDSEGATAEPQYYTVEQIAELLHLPVEAVYRALRDEPEKEPR